MKQLLFSIIALSIFNAAFAEEQHPFSNQAVHVGTGTYFPYIKGKVKEMHYFGNESAKPYSAVQVNKLKSEIDQIKGILSGWSYFTPPQGAEIAFFKQTYHIDDDKGNDAIKGELTLYISAYFADQGEGGPTTDPEFHADLNIYLNDLSNICGSPLIGNIYPQPEKVANFFGYPIYQNNRQEITVISKKNIPLFLKVSQEEYLNTMIKTLEKHIDENFTKPKKERQQRSSSQANSEKDTRRMDFEKAYKELLKIDRNAAEQLKKDYAETDDVIAQQENDAKDFESESEDCNKSFNEQLESLRKELAALSPEERKQQAWWGNSTENDKISELVPPGQGEALVRLNPAIIDHSKPESEIQLMTLDWSVRGADIKYDKPRQFDDKKAGSYLQDWLMAKLYYQEYIWKQIFKLVK